MLLLASIMNEDIEEAAAMLTSWTDEPVNNEEDLLTNYLNNINEVGNMTMSSEEVKTMMQQVNSEEIRLPNMVEELFDNVVEDMQKYAASGQETFTLKELSFETLSSAFEHYNQKED